MTNGADAADAGSNSRHLVEWPSLGKFLESTDLRYVELRSGDMAAVVQGDGDFRMAFYARYRIDGDALRRHSLAKLHGQIPVALATLDQIKDDS